MQGFFPEIRLVDQPYFAYRGGKARLRRYIIRWCPLKGSTYCEPFAGRASMFFLMKGIGKFNKWHLNDTQTTPFFRSILQYDGNAIPEMTKEQTEELYRSGNSLHWLMEPITYRCGHLACKNGQALGTKSYNLDNYRQRLITAKRCLQGVRITDVDAVVALRRYSEDPLAFVYLDPPYLGAKVGTYDDRMVDWPGLFCWMKMTRCRWLFSHYPHPRIASEFGRPIATIKNVWVTPSNKAEGRREVEALWANYPAKINVIDFGDRDRQAMKESWQLIREHRVISWADWPAMCPQRWSKQTVKIQFNRLSLQPSHYFDGETLVIVGESDD